MTDAGRDFEREIVVKTNAPELLRAELARRSWRGEHVALGTNTDPYQWVEGRYRLMPGTEPHTPSPRARLEAVAELTRAGIRTGVLVAPLMPGVNDAPEQIEPILEQAAEAGADYVTAVALHLRGEVRGLFFAWLREHRPDLVERYSALYQHGAYAPVAERRRLARLIRGPDLPAGQRMRARVERTPGLRPSGAEGQIRLF